MSEVNVPKLAQVWPIRKIESRAGAMRLASEWEDRARHLEEYALTLELIVASYKLELAFERRECERLRGLIG